MTLPPDVSAVVSSRDPGIAVLVKFDFLSITKRVWTGFGKLPALDGTLWEGLGELVTIDGLGGGALSGTAPAGKLSVSGVSPQLIATAIGEKIEFMQRPVSLFLQGFQNGALVGNPAPLGLRIMTSMDITRNASTRTISINHESPYVGRNNPRFGFYSDRDQQGRFPGDRFCERVPFLLFKRETWPSY